MQTKQYKRTSLYSSGKCIEDVLKEIKDTYDTLAKNIDVVSITIETDQAEYSDSHDTYMTVYYMREETEHEEKYRLENEEKQKKYRLDYYKQLKKEFENTGEDK